MVLLASDAGGTVVTAKTVLATTLVVLAVHQVFLMAVGYGKLRVPFLAPAPASSAHRAIGDAAVLVTLAVSYLCISRYETGDAMEDGGRSRAHVVGAIALLAVLAAKIACVRLGGPLGRLLPYLGVTVLALFTTVWAVIALPNLGGS